MIFCCGEAVIDMLPVKNGSSEIQYAAHTGGAVYNTAIALAKLETKVSFFSGLSSDFFGEFLRADLEAHSIDYSFSVISDRPSTVAYVNYTDKQASYSFYDEGSAGRMLDVDDLPDFPKAQAFFFGGISFAVEPCCHMYEALLTIKALDHFIMVDPNIRADFIRDVEAFRHRITKVLSLATVVKVSDEDLCWIYPEEDALDSKVKALIASGPEIVFLTKGADGADAYGKSGLICSVSGEIIEVVDTIGAGDTFNAGILAKFSQLGLLSVERMKAVLDEEVKQALQFATKAAAISVSRAGANPPSLAEVIKGL